MLNITKLENQIIDNIKKNIPERLAHTLSVRDIAILIASHYKIDKEKASLAALCHDIGRMYSREDMFSILKKSGKEYPSFYNKNILHAYVGVIVAQNEFNINDEEILLSIKNHTVGKIGMGMLEKIIYVSDYIEPTRNIEKTAQMRVKVLEDFDSVFLETIKDSLTHVLSKNDFVVYDTLELYNSLVINKNTL